MTALSSVASTRRSKRVTLRCTEPTCTILVVTWHECPEHNCSYNSKQERHIKQYRSNVHGIGVTWYSCTELGCEYKAKEKGSLKKHRAMVHAIDVLWWFCDNEGC